MISENVIRFEVEDGVPFLPGFDLEQDKALSDEEVCAIAMALVQLLPSDTDEIGPWQRAARLEAVGRRL